MTALDKVPVNPVDEQAISELVAKAVADLQAAQTLEEIKQARLTHLGDQSVLVITNKTLGQLDKTQRPLAGQIIGKARGEITKILNERQIYLTQQAEEAMLQAQRVDVTTAVNRKPQGARHPLETLVEDISDFFVSMGWEIADGPQLEHEWFNFDALNFGPDHPARQMQDTFYLNQIIEGEQERDIKNLVLRTHTSPVQARTLLAKGAPVYIACPGKVFRTDALDATHTPVFHQVEGLAVDKGITMAHLRGVLDHFAKYMFGPTARTRLRPSFFPFTEPSAEMDLWFEQKKGGPGWIEWGGCGMVNPEVLKNCGIDPEVYTGFAFGMGVERTLMLRHGIADMHDMVEGDIRFSQQFGVTGRGA